MNYNITIIITFKRNSSNKTGQYSSDKSGQTMIYVNIVNTKSIKLWVLFRGFED